MEISRAKTRVSNSPLLMYVNFKDGSSVNMVELNKPYADGTMFAVYNTSEMLNGKMFKSVKKAMKFFNKLTN